MEKTSRVEVPGFPRRSKINPVVERSNRVLRFLISQQLTWLRSLPLARLVPPLQRVAQALFQTASDWQGRLRDLAFPVGCGRCGTPIPDQERWCRDCRQSLGVAAHPPLAKSRCPRCAAIRPPEACSAQGCIACVDLDLPFDSVSALGSYHGGLRRWVIDVKRTLDSPLIAALAQALVEDLADRGIDRQIDLVIPVPPRRLGIPASDSLPVSAHRPSAFFAATPYDSSAPPLPPLWPPRSTSPTFWVSLWKISVSATHRLMEHFAWLSALGSRHGSLPTQLAERIALALGLPLLTNLVQYRRPTRKQGQLRIADRLRNVRHAMALRRFAKPARVAGKRILLVDDVLTSGATLAELARVLRLAGASQIHVVVLARAAADR